MFLIRAVSWLGAILWCSVALRPDCGLAAVYGQDDRLDPTSPTISPELRAMSLGTAVLVPTNRVRPIMSGGKRSIRVEGPSLGAKFNLCTADIFSSQPAPGFCSAFLVAPDLLVTAGHCVMSPQACAATTAVFGFQVGADAAAPQQFAEAQIYQCKELVASKIDPGSGLDYSIFKVDRVVSVAAPLPLRKTGHPRRHDRLTALAYPHGGPLKVINGGQIRSIDLDKTFFVANIDGFTGNSGSPVIGVEGTVEGIIVRGAESYAQEDGCLRAIHCAEDECRGEDVLMTREFFGQLATPGPAIVLTNVAVNESLGNGNGLPEPGETLDLSLTIKNQGLARAAKASITLFGQAQGVRFDGVPEGLSDLEPGALQVIHGVRMKLPQTIECGRLRVYAFTRTGESPSVSSHVQFDLGRTVYERFDVASNVTLPEVMPDGQAFDVDILGAPTSRRVLFDVGIRHERPRQLVIEAKAPDGQTALLYKNGLSHVQWPPNAGPQTVNGVYGLSLEPFEDISNFRTVKAPGTWTITVRDVGRGYAAQIDSLSILFGEQKCEPSR